MATFSLSGPDPDFAEGWPNSERSLYLYRLAIRRMFAGQDVGGRVLDWASLYAEADGCAWLRLDVHRDNPRLQLYYARRGFARVGTVVHPTRVSGALYQRPAGTVYAEGKTVSSSDNDRYDPEGKAAIWQAAAKLVSEMKDDGLS